MWPNSTGACTPFSYKARAEDFRVLELPLPASDTRRIHWYACVEKQNRTTISVASQLATSVGLPLSSVGYAGMKDKVGITQQWFSLPLAPSQLAQFSDGTSGPVAAIAADDSLRLQGQAFQGRKLRRGELFGNRFQLRLVVRSADAPAIDLLLPRLQATGMPNYFGPQRFGDKMSNVTLAKRWLASRNTQRGRSRQIKPFTKALHLSVARAYLFNQVLAQRVRESSWHRVLDGDLCQGLQPTAPLWGRGRSLTRRTAAELESRALAAHQELQLGLEHAGVTQMRRALWVKPTNFGWSWEQQDPFAQHVGLRLWFDLPPGTYATSLLAELGTPVLARRRAENASTTPGQPSNDPAAGAETVPVSDQPLQGQGHR